MKDHNIDRLVDALQRLTIEVQLFREAFVANNMSICESCSNNPCNKKAMLGDRRILECTMYDHKTENSSEIPNNCEHITEDGVTCAKYPACDDCPDNPLNKVKSSKRLVKGSENPNNCEPQKWTKENCKGCKYNEYPYDSGTCFVRVCINGNKYEPKTEPSGYNLTPVDKDINVHSKEEPQTERSE